MSPDEMKDHDEANRADSEHRKVNGDVDRLITQIGALSPVQQEALYDRLADQIDELHERQYDQATADLNTAMDRAKEAIHRMEALEEPDEDEDRPPKVEPSEDFSLERLRESERERLLTEDPEPRLTLLSGVHFGPMEKWYFREALLVASHLVASGSLSLVPPAEYPEEDQAESFFDVVREISRGMFAVRHDMLMNDIEWQAI